jgi:O-antigen/teichoic acid export membrane protein
VIRAIGYDKSRGRELLRSSLPLRKVAAYITTLAFFTAVLVWEKDPQTQAILACFSLAMLGRSFAQWNLAMFTAFEANRFSFRLQAIFRPLEVVLGLAALAAWRNPLAIVLVHAGVWWMEVAFGNRLLRKEFSMPAGTWNFSDIKAILAESIPMCILVTLTSVMCQGPLLIFKNLSGTGIAAGNLALAMQVFSILSQVSIALSSASYPALSRTIARGDGKEVFYVETIMRFILLFGHVAFLGTALGPTSCPWF